jgi:hypothetical protein
MFFYSPPDPKTIVVPERVLAPGVNAADLLAAVETFMIRGRDEGCYNADEMEPDLGVLYATNYYVSQVSNGGHRQFVHNSRMESQTVDTAIKGLNSVGMPELSGCLSRLKADLEAKLTPDYDDLDKVFFARSSAYPAAMHAWIRPKVKGLSPRKYAAHMARLVARTDARQARYEVRMAIGWQAALCNRLRAGFDLAAFHEGKQLFVRKILPGQFFTFAFSEEIAWNLEMADGSRLKGIMLPGVTLIVSEHPKVPVNDAKAATAFFSNALKVTDDVVTAAIAHAEATCPGFLALELLRKARIAPDEVAIFGHVRSDGLSLPKGMRLYHIELASKRQLQLAVSADQADLIDREKRRHLAETKETGPSAAERIVAERLRS